ncbi:MAG: universal stress protein [Gammaproteobacteria bacterium]|jgi:nucleotide-binding universal stress UspA family protein|nr:universal stress protein [Gammaproteobacteria bacterium]
MKPFENILFVSGEIKGELDALARAASLARKHGSRLTVASVVDRVPSWGALLLRQLAAEDLQQAVIEQRRADLDVLVRAVAEDLDVERRVFVGTPFLEIIRAVLRDGYDLVAKAGEGPSARFLGSTDMHLVRKCPVPVWIDEPGRHAAYRRVLAAVDPSPEDPLRDNLDGLILGHAAGMAAAFAAELHVLHAWSLVGEAALTGPFVNMAKEDVATLGRAARRRAQTELDALLLRYPPGLPGWRAHLLKGSAASVIPGFARRRRIDLIVLGTVGRTGLPGFFIGNTAENVLRQVGCSVLAVKPDGFVSPVTLEA